MSYDLNILVVGQQVPSRLPFNASIGLINEMQEVLRYNEIWRYMTETRGIWYCLGKEENGWFNALSIVEADFDKCMEERPTIYWIKEEDIRNNLTPLRVKEGYMDEFNRIISYLVHESPNNTALFMARYQGGEHEIVCGVLSLEEFIDLLSQEKVLFNVCYIIRD